MAHVEKGNRVELTQFKVMTFDCYGTLIDWESGLLKSLMPLTNRLKRKLSQNMILQTYARQETLQQSQTPTKPYPELMAIVYKRIAEEWSLPVSWDECLQHGQSLKDWPAFPDSAESLTYLQKHYRLVVLSNIDNDSFSASNAKLGVTFDAIYTAQDIGSYKPDDRNFHYMIDALARSGIQKAEILHTAQSLYHDHRPANRLGLKSCWIDRRHNQDGAGATLEPNEIPRYDFRFCSMAEMAEAHRQLATD